MSLYPSLEDMKVDQMAQAQVAQHQQQHAAIAAPQPGTTTVITTTTQPAAQHSSLYPSLDDYMGLTLTPEMVSQYAVQPSAGNAVAVPQSSGIVAPVTGHEQRGIMGVKRAEVKQGVREIITCKDEKGKVGLRVRAINKGVFIQFVFKDSPASLAGLRFGDQILQINGETLAGYSDDKVMKILKNSAPQRIVLAIRDRPFERSITLQKDSTGHCGFVYKGNKINQIVKDSSAARNGLLIDHYFVEVNGQNVVGLKDDEVKKVIESAGKTITLTILPSFLYDHIMKSMSFSLVKKNMDHSVPDV